VLCRTILHVSKEMPSLIRGNACIYPYLPRTAQAGYAL
jgi:hypothetical protein